MEDYEARPKEKHVKETDEAEEELHVDAGFVTDLSFKDDCINAVHYCAECCHCIAQRNLPGGFGRESAAAVAVISWVALSAREVDTGYENDTNQGCDDTGEFADCESFDTENGPEDEGPDT